MERKADCWEVGYEKQDGSPRPAAFQVSCLGSFLSYTVLDLYSLKLLGPRSEFVIVPIILFTVRKLELCPQDSDLSSVNVSLICCELEGANNNENPYVKCQTDNQFCKCYRSPKKG
jgi:hypothetical protein